MKTNLLYLLTFFITSSLFSQQNFTQDWTYNANELQGDQYIFPSKFNSFELDYTLCKDYLYQAFLYDYAGNIKQSNIEIILPMPDGSLELFKIAESPVYEPEFAAEFPDIRTFMAYAPNHPNWYARFDITPMGFHGIIFNTQGGTIYIDPIIYRGEDVNHYFSYYKKDWQRNEAFSCYFDEGSNTPIPLDTNNSVSTKMFGTCQLRTYRLAVAATGEYTTFQGGTVALAAAAQVTTMNRVNGVYEMDMGIHMNIIGNNSLIIYTNAATDPYTNGTPGTMINENQTNITTVIGSANYDIGHVFGTNSGGLAGLGVVCNNSNKARGVTGSGAPVGDSFDIDYVAHEMGHQFNANHTQNNNCNRNSATAMEPGSASTIMGYAGICAPNVQNNSDDYFHGVSLQEIGNLITSGTHTCPVVTNISNAAPTVTYSPTTINLPISTPFALTATASDPNAGDTLRYLWEQMDNQTATMPPVSTATGGPNFRSFDPTTSPTRYFPNLTAVVAGTTPTWEVLPSVARTMHFRVTVHDNFPGANCNDNQDITVNFISSAGPFTVTYPTNTGITWAGNSTQTVTWNVANTGSGTTVNCSNVNILISYDGGLTFSDTVLANTPNDGSQSIIVPNQATTTALIMVQCANGTFFDVSNNVFTITAVTNDFTIAATPTSQTVCSGDNAQYTINVGKLGSFSTNVVLNVSGLPGALSTSFSNNNQAPAYSSTLTIGNTAAIAPGTYNFTLTGTGATGTKNVSLTLIVTGTLSGSLNLTAPVNAASSVSVPTNFTWSNIVGATYSITIATDAAFTNIVESSSGLSSASYTSTILAANTMYYWQVLAYNTCDTITSNTFNFTTVNCATYASTDVPKTISASGTPTVTSNLPIAGSVGIINDINVIDLTGTHTYISDLTFTLTSPSGTSVDLIDQICGSQNNFNINFDDEASSSSYPCPPIGGGTYIPENALSAFDGESANGTWILTIQDNANQDGGELQTWGLEICFSPPPCNSVTENASITECDSALVNGNWYFSSIIVNDTLEDYFGTGCDSITIYNVTINNSQNTSENQSACDSAFVFGAWYYASQSVSQTFVSNANCDSTHTINLTINYASPTNTINTTTCDANLVGSDTTTFSNAFGCDSVVITNTTLLPTAFGVSNVSACDSVFVNGSWYYATTSFNDTLSGQAANGCDSVVTYNVSISNSVATMVSISACDSANVNGTWYFASQNVVSTFTAANTCDSTHTVSLTINNAQSTSENQSACDSAFVFGTWYYASQSVSQTFVSNANCDSTHTINLTINYASPTNTINNTTCDANMVGSDTTTFSNANGCDSIVITNTTLLPTAFGTSNVSACDSAFVNGTWYFATTSFNDTLSGQAANGCDSVVTYNVSISNSVATTESISACDSANVNGTWYFASQNVVSTFTAANTCDSTHTVSLTINNSQYTSENQSACDSAFVFGMWYFASQSVSQTFVSIANCDSTHTVNLTINYTSPINNINNTTCDANLVGSDTTTFSNAFGCDSVVITNTTLLPTAFGTSNVSACDSAFVNGSWYFATASFNDTLSGQAANGCDSVVTYNVSISNSMATTESISACDSAYVNGTWYFASQNVVSTFTAANSCDSTHTVSLTINNAQNTSENQSACDSAFVFGTWYFASQSVSQTFVSNANCDSTHTVNLTINYASPTNTVNTTTCDANLVGSDTTTFSNANGCDSVVITNTTLLPTASGTSNVFACDSALVNGSWYFATTSFNDTLSGQAANGCDSVVTYNVSISNSVATTESISACDSANVNGTWYFASQNVVSTFTAANTCDSTHTVSLTINNAQNTSENQSACDSAFVYGAWYFASQSVSQTFVSAANCDSTHIINLTINYASPTNTINTTTCDANLVGSDTTTFSNANGCDSIVITNTTLLPTTFGTSNVSACDSALVNGSWYFASTSFNDTLSGQAANGCDSVVTYNVSISNSVATTESISACDSANVNGTWYFTSQNVVSTFTAANTCDSTHTVSLTINNSQNTSENQSACDSAFVYGAWYYASQSVSQTFVSNANCDSTHTINLTINYASPTNTINNTTCDANMVGSDTTTYSNANGCDSVVITNTTLLPTAFGTSNVSACDSAFVNGSWYFATTSFNDTLSGQAANGCDSVVTYNVSISNSVATTESISACDSANVNGTWYFASQNVVSTFTAANSCDSTHTVSLTINNSQNTSENQSGCDSAFVFGTWYFASQSVSQTFVSNANCDSTHTVNLTINYASPTNTINNTTCDANLVGSDTTTFSNVNGCDSVVITNTTLLPTAFGTSNVSACDSAFVNGTWYFATTSFNDTLSGQAANGCDSVVTYNVSISNSVATTESISACDSANINGTWYFASQNVVSMFTAANSCDSTHTVSLTINNAQNTSENQSACDSAFVFGTWYYASQSVSQTFVSNANCDSTHTINLTINYASPTNTVNTTTCDANLVGSDTTTFSNANGCDSIVITNTTLLPTAFGASNVSACDSAMVNGTWYFTSTSFNDTLIGQAANGCDSVVTYNVSISNAVFSVDTSVACGTQDSTLFISHFTANNGCDSTHYQLVFYTNQVDSNFIQSTSCEPTDTGIFVNTFTNINGCDSVVVEEINYAPFNLLIQASNDTQFITQDIDLWVNSQADNYNWQTLNTTLSNDSALTYTSNFVGDYLLIVEGNSGPCYASDSIRLYFISNYIEPGIPTGFSPNGDGINDYFYVLNNQYFDWIEIKVLSERNQVMFYESGENPKWDGTFKDSNAPIEVYIYSIRAKVKYTGEIIDKLGNVSLIR